jgi:hypothetical protein
MLIVDAELSQEESYSLASLSRTKMTFFQQAFSV